MGINPGVIGLAVYLLLGIVSLVVFDLATKRIRSKFTQATSETQSRLAASGNFVGRNVASILFLGAMWLFWPIVFVGIVFVEALTDKEDNSHGT